MAELRQEETQVLRECIYAMQGINGQHLSFNSANNAISIQLSDDLSSAPSDPAVIRNSRLGAGMEDALSLCCKAGWYYKRVQAYIQRVEQSSEVGFVARAWAEALSSEMMRHGSLLADLDATLMDHNSTLTLRQLLIRIREPTNRLRTLAILVDGLSILQGGQLLTSLYRHSLHGDSCHASLVRNMLAKASRPWFDALYLWTTQGSLCDEHGEFFVTETMGEEDDFDWQHTFQIDPERIPLGILNENLVQSSLNIGKGINYVRKCLLDSGWKAELPDHIVCSENDESIKVILGYSYMPDHMGKLTNGSQLTNTLKNFEEQLNTYIVRSLLEQHKLMEHLHALKQFLLLGQGDFFSALMESLHEDFEQRNGIIGLYEYVLSGLVDAAFKSTNAINIPDSIRRCLFVKVLMEDDDDARYMFASPRDGAHEDDGRTGWDVFGLEYNVPVPLVAVVHDRAMEQYRQVFSLLFGLKRIEFLLNHTWRQSTALHHAIQVFAQYNAINMQSKTDYIKATALLRRISMTRQSMMHFVVNIKSYLFFEVLEGAWKNLCAKLDQSSSLDDMIIAHDVYLADIVQKSLPGTEDVIEGVADALGTHIRQLLSLAQEFCTFQGDLFEASTTKAEQATKKRKDAERRSKLGDWGFASEEDVEGARSFFGLTDESKLKEATVISDEFNRGTRRLLTCLNEISHGKPSRTAVLRSPTSTTDSASAMSSAVYRDQFDLDSLQFLSFQLDYSGFYDLENII